MQQLHLSIPEPCHENWNQMSPNEQGRFCNSCAKTVVDFSIMTDAQLLFYFENLKNENVCGHLYEDQLERSIQALPQPRKKIFAYWQYVIAFFMILSKGQQAKAQGRVTGEMVVKPDTIKKPSDIHIRLGKIRSQPLPANTKAIGAALPQYFITDEKDQPIANTSVQLLPQGNWLVSDSTGKINLGKDHQVERLVVSAVGFVERTVILKDLTGNNIQLAYAKNVLGEVSVKSNYRNRAVYGVLGGMSYVRAKTSKSSLKDSVLKIFTPVQSGLVLFPNPVTKGKMLNFSIAVKQTGSYEVQVTDALGRILLQQNKINSSKKITEQLFIPSDWSSGIYYMTLYNEKNTIIGSGKFLLQ